VLFILLAFLGVEASRDETAACRDVTRQTCSGFQSCCARKCGGPHQTTCTESFGRISQASCDCESRSPGGSGSSHGRTTDHSTICRLAAEGNCNSFKACCENRCARPARLSCSARGSSLTESVCECPASPGTGGFLHTTTSRYGHGGGSPHHTTPGFGHREGGLREHEGEQDFTHTCSRNYHDCTAFRTCCQNRCSGRTIQTQCQERGRELKNTLCKCGRPISGRI